MVTEQVDNFFSDTPRRLLRTPVPEQDESYLGYLLRLTEANGYENISWINQLARLRPGSPWKVGRIRGASVNLTLLSTMTGIGISTLRRLPYLLVTQPGGGEYYKVEGHTLPTHAVNATRGKICPQCLREEPYLRKSWELLPVTACVRHAAKLVEFCAGCGNKLKWQRREVCRCSCGYDWRQTPPDDALDEPELDVSRYFEHIVHPGSTSTEVIGTTRTNPLFRSAPSAFLGSLSFVAGHWEPEAQRFGRISKLGSFNERLHQTFTRALTVFDRWPENLYAFLAEYRGKINQNPKREVFTVGGDFPLFGKLYISSVYENLNLLREGFESYLQAEWDGGHIRSRVRYSGWPKDATRYVTIEWARRTTSLREGLDHLIKTGRIRQVTRKTSSGRRVHLLERADVLTAAAEKHGVIDRQSVVTKLGVSQSPRVMELVKDGLLHPADRPFGESRRRYKFQISEVNNLLVALESRIVLGPESQEENWPFAKFANELGRFGMTLAPLVRAILGGEVLIRGRGEAPGMTGFLFSAREARSWLGKQRDKDNANNAMLSTRQVCSQIHIKLHTFYWLVGEGLLNATRKSFGGMAGLVVSEATLEAFQKEYVFGSHLAKKLRTRPFFLARVLAEHGINPVVAPLGKIGFSRIVYKQQDLIRADFAAITPKKGNERAILQNLKTWLKLVEQ